MSVLSIAISAPKVSAQASLDPQSLIGEWNRSWVDKRQGKNTGPYSITIERIDGTEVYGSGELWTPRSFPFKFKGTLEGDRLTFGRDTKTELTINGKQMTGSSAGPNAARNITINKQK
jgi:hypothetical protein